MGVFQLKKQQVIAASLDEVWDFMSSPKNLQKITPEHMGFTITSNNANQPIYPGMIVTYKVSPLLGIPLTWVTEITQVKEGHFFIDEQRMGPYTMWHHQHLLTPTDKGILMEDIVTYIPPMGILGNLANTLFIKKQLAGIFNYRTQAVNQLFPTS